jgi:23S rRNA pseudouridine1911/1915/1917 synthase
MLHARTLGFQHPVTGEAQEFTRLLPVDMEMVSRMFEALAHAGSETKGKG